MPVTNQGKGKQGGKRPGSGRKPGSVTKKKAELALKAAEQGLSPIDFMLEIMRDVDQPLDIRFEAAKASAPYVHPRLNAVTVDANVNFNHEDALNDLDPEGKEDQASTS